MRVLLLSTYELGEQPLGIALPAGYLRAAGHAVRSCDLSIEPVGDRDLAWAEAIICSVPMHTALRLALAALEPLRAARPELRVALHGLYAPVGAPNLRPRDLAVAGEVLESLAAWLEGIASAAPLPSAPEGVPVEIVLGPARPSRGDATVIPDRDGLPPFDRYARLISPDGDRLVGAVESTRGCSHRCRHCPVPTIYSGRTRTVPVEAVLADIAQVVAAGATHVHFADPDFLNRPAHARRVVEAMQAQFPHVSFDATIKVSHILGQPEAVTALGASGCVFVITAIESTSDEVLARLDKGHRGAEAGEAIVALRSAGIEPRPSFLPFTPWTSLTDVVELLDFVARFDLIGSVDPVQYGIRLLIPPGSLLLDRPDPALRAALGAYDPDELGWSWRAADPAVDQLQQAIAARTEMAAAQNEEFAATYGAVRALVFDALGAADPGRPAVASTGRPDGRPHLSEAWFCCAEPTAAQFDGLFVTRGR